jgi:hypothetical protein
MQRALLSSVSIFVVTWAANAAADPPNLKGAYGFTGTAACLIAPGSVPGATMPLSNPIPGTALPNSGFQPDLHPKDGNAFSQSHAVEGIRTFNGDGTGTVKGTSVGITVPPTPGPNGYPHFPPGAGSSNFSFSFTYTVNGDGSWTAMMVPGTYTETFLTGGRAGQTATIDAIPPVTGLISANASTLILVADPTDPITGGFIPTVETVSYSNGDVWPQICHRSRVLIKLLGHDDDNHGDNNGH